MSTPDSPSTPDERPEVAPETDRPKLGQLLADPIIAARIEQLRKQREEYREPSDHQSSRDSGYWNYRFARRLDMSPFAITDPPTWIYDIREFHYDKDGNLRGWSAEPVFPMAESWTELIDECFRMASGRWQVFDLDEERFVTGQPVPDDHDRLEAHPTYGASPIYAVTFTCPKCGRTSHHPEDAEAGYCGSCHEFTGQRTESGLYD